MKVLCWNCHQAFRDKYKEVLKFNADIYVISEAENPEKYADNPQYADYLDFCSNGKWIGGYKDGKLYEDKGLFIFAKKDITLKNNHWDSKHEFFLSFRVNDILDIVGVWTQPKYVEEVYPPSPPPYTSLVIFPPCMLIVVFP